MTQEDEIRSLFSLGFDEILKSFDSTKPSNKSSHEE